VCNKLFFYIRGVHPLGKKVDPSYLHFDMNRELHDLIERVKHRSTEYSEY
jgi:hypothetical protein